MLRIFWTFRRVASIKPHYCQSPERHVRSEVVGSSCCKPYGPLSCQVGFPKSSLNSSWTIGPKTWLFLIRSALSQRCSCLLAQLWKKWLTERDSQRIIQVVLCCITSTLPGKLVLPQLSHTWRLLVWTPKPRAHCYVALTWPAHIKENVILMLKNMHVRRAG